MIQKISNNLYDFSHGAVSFTVSFLSSHLIICGTIGQQIFTLPSDASLNDLPSIFSTNKAIIERATLYTETAINKKKYVEEIDRIYREKLIDDSVRLRLLDVFYSCKCGSMVLKKRLKEAGLYKWTEHMDFEELEPTLLAHIGAIQLLIREVLNEKNVSK